ncbi:hypothetical protein [Streptomyces sp. NPDC002520]
MIIDTGLAKHIPADALRAAGALDEEGRPVRDPARQHKNRPTGSGDRRLVRHQPAARRTRRGLLRELRHQPVGDT